jgi:hypothetical protein
MFRAPNPRNLNSKIFEHLKWAVNLKSAVLYNSRTEKTAVAAKNFNFCGSGNLSNLSKPTGLERETKFRKL